MADIFTIIGILALAYTGKKLSERKEPVEEYTLAPTPVPQSKAHTTRKLEQTNIFNDIAPDRYPGGLPYYLSDASNPYVSGIMNNVAPVPKNFVGPGLGVDPNVESAGGFQQFFRVLPNNVGGYKKTTLLGRAGPPAKASRGMPGVVGQLTQFPRKDEPGRGPAPGRAQGMTGQSGIPSHEYSKRMTNRAETTSRSDGLGFGPAKKFISGPSIEADPSRNKSDVNYTRMNSVAAPGITSFVGGYEVTPIGQLMAGTDRKYTPEQLQKFGLRLNDTREKNDRLANPGRMNVRGNAVDQNGMVTTVRLDTGRMDGRMGPVNGGRMQQYKGATFQNNNTYKGQMNPYATNDFLATAKTQMLTNPFAQVLN